MVALKEAIVQSSKEWKVRLCLAAVLLLGLLPLLAIGLDFGMDFKGGTMIQLQTEKAISTSDMDTVVAVLSNRLNGFGLRDVSVKPWGSEFVIVQISETDPQAVSNLESVISQQGKFEAVIDGRIALVSQDLMTIITNPREGYGYLQSTGQWSVPFELTADGAQRFADAAKGQCKKVEGTVECSKVYVFIDRPENAILLMPTSLYKNESKMKMSPESDYSGGVDITEAEKNALVKIVQADNISDATLARLGELKNESWSKVIVLADYDYGDLKVVEALGYKVELVKKTGFYWFWDATKLQSILGLGQELTDGKPIRNARITGGARTMAEAMNEMTKMVVLLRSGKLPVTLSIASTSTVSPTMGKGFLTDSWMLGVVALIAVACVVFYRYRRLDVGLLMISINACEIVMVLGTAALIHWQIDLAAMAGVLAAIGTGLEQMIIITDEAIMQKEGEMEISLLGRIKNAFNIIFFAAATTIGAMLPLMTVGLGMLKGFAITTIIGVMIGTLVSRPAYGSIVERILRQQ